MSKGIFGLLLSAAVSCSSPSPSSHIEHQQETTHAIVDTFDHDGILCGLSYDQLSDSQKKLFSLLDVDQKEALSSVVTIDPVACRIDFHVAGFSLAMNDLAQDISYIDALPIVRNVSDGWRLPRDIDYGSPADTSFLSSDIEKIVASLPFSTREESVNAFVLLTNMSDYYWTLTSYKGIDDTKILFGLDGNKLDRRWNYTDFHNNVRLIKDL